MMSEFVLRFDEVQDSHRDRAGGKGHTLSRLCEGGFPVPPGFIITTDAYHAFVTSNDLDALIAAAVAGDDTAAASARIGAAFEEAEMPPAVATAICDAYLALGESEVAVRSSAVAEDSEAASYAGQYDSFLGMSGCNDLLTAVRRCWASLWSERALAYRQRLGSAEGAPAMAVIVQRLIPAAQAGVAFTMDPVNGRRDVIVVEAAAGRSEPLVSGRATPQRYVVQRRNDSVKSSAGVLDAARLAAVVRLAEKVEAREGQPQDVEWALDGAGRVHLLQARPITVAGASASDVVARWTRDNVGEVLPDPVTPLSWSVLDPLGNRSFACVLRRLGVDDYPDAGLFGRFYGRVYLNHTLFQAMMSRFYPSRAGWRAAPRLALTAQRALVMLRRLPVESEEAIGAILELRRSEADLDLAVLAPEDVLDRLANWRRLGAAAMEVHLAVTVMAELLYQALDKLLTRWGGGAATATALTAGLTGVRSAETGQALGALAQQIGHDDDLRALVLTAIPEALPARLAETETGRALWAQIGAFLAEHGHGTAQEFELAAPRWRDDPAIILSALQAQVHAAREESVADPTATRLAAVARVERLLSPPKRWLFRRLLRRAQVFTAARENLKYHFVIAQSRLRDLYLALAARLVAAGRLISPEDVFFLTAEEVEALFEERLATDDGPDESDGGATKRVAERRQAWEACQRAVVPLAFDQWADGRLCPVPPPASADDSGGPLLRGLAASPGVYTGRARVLFTLADGADIEPGEVLVAAATSPGWAPLLLAAGALVTEIGGMLSHGAIIAREYGLPAVLNVASATRRIRTGQLVHVDGSRGAVRLLEDVERELGASED